MFLVFSARHGVLIPARVEAKVGCLALCFHLISRFFFWCLFFFTYNLNRLFLVNFDDWTLPFFVANHGSELDIKRKFWWRLQEIFSTRAINHGVHNISLWVHHSNHLITCIVNENVAFCVYTHQLWPIKFVLSERSILTTWTSTNASYSAHIGLLNG
jgi:hypothetical protein